MQGNETLVAALRDRGRIEEEARCCLRFLTQAGITALAVCISLNHSWLSGHGI